MNDKQALEQLRSQIDALDSEIVSLLNKRALIAQEIGEVKTRLKLPIYRPERENEVLSKVCAKSEGPLTDQALVAIWREVMSACRSLELTIKVAYLGPRGTFSEQAMVRQFGSTVEGIPCATIEQVFKKISGEEAAFGIVPIENSTEGSVNRTMDCLLKTDLFIVGECSIPVHQNLMTKSGTLEGIERVYSHPQSLGQCVLWLNQNLPRVERIAVASNGEAARLASEEPGAAAIAGERAGEIFGLKKVAASIQDSSGNRTRFVILSKNPSAASEAYEKDKTSLIFSLPHRAGSLYHALKPFDDYGISMTRFESRPAKSGTWEYFFYTDIEGNANDPKVKQALEAFRAGCSSLKNLGSYPAEADFSSPIDLKGSKL